MMLLIWFLVTIACGINGSEKHNPVLSVMEKECKRDMQQLCTGHGISSFNALSMHRKELYQKLITSMECSTTLPMVCSQLVLEYCRAWITIWENPHPQDS